MDNEIRHYYKGVTDETIILLTLLNTITPQLPRFSSNNDFIRL